MLMCHNSNYTKGRAGSIQYIVLHYTANNGDTAKGNCSYFSRTANIVRICLEYISRKFAKKVPIAIIPKKVLCWDHQ